MNDKLPRTAHPECPSSPRFRRVYRPVLPFDFAQDKLRSEGAEWEGICAVVHKWLSKFPLMSLDTFFLRDESLRKNTRDERVGRAVLENPEYQKYLGFQKSAHPEPVEGSLGCGQFSGLIKSIRTFKPFDKLRVCGW